MCNNCCYRLIIKQIYCQNGTPRTQYLTLTSININTNIRLDFGYTLTISSLYQGGISLLLNDSVYNIPSQSIDIDENSYKMISLPAQNGTYRLYIILQSYCCCCTR